MERRQGERKDVGKGDNNGEEDGRAHDVENERDAEGV